jgi:hypothetical protein
MLCKINLFKFQHRVISAWADISSRLLMYAKNNVNKKHEFMLLKFKLFKLYSPFEKTAMQAEISLCMSPMYAQDLNKAGRRSMICTFIVTEKHK